MTPRPRTRPPTPPPGDPRWRDRAACAGETSIDWFAEWSTPAQAVADAEPLCHTCPALAACHADAEATRATETVRAGRWFGPERFACGHPRTPDNTSDATTRDGRFVGAYCRQCRREKAHLAAARKRAHKPPNPPTGPTTPDPA